MTSKEKIRDIKSVINEFYHNEKCEGRLTECARKSWLLFQEYCDDILQDLERLETLEKENEKLKKAIEIIKNHLHVKELDIDYILEFNSLYSNHLTQQEYELLKEVLIDE